MEGYKTFVIAILMLMGTFGLVFAKVMPPDAWDQTAYAVAAMIGLREFASKGGLGIKGPGNADRGPSRPGE